MSKTGRDERRGRNRRVGDEEVCGKKERVRSKRR